MRTPFSTPVLRSGRRRHAVPASLTVALLSLLVVLGVAPAAHAHDVMVGSDPAEGDVLDGPPESVVVSFSADQMDVGAAIAVVDPAGVDHVVEGPVVEGRDVRVGLDGAGEAGEWQVTWRSVSSDGHPISGSFTFTVTAAATEEEPAGTSATDGADEAEQPGTDTDTDTDTGAAPEDLTDEVADEPAPVADEVPVAADDARTAEDDADGSRPSALLVALLAVGGVAAVAVVVVLLRRLRPTDADDRPGPVPDERDGA